MEPTAKLEMLESRMYLNGDVTVAVTGGGNLNIRNGAGGSSQIEVTQVGAEYVITGAGGTTINGEAAVTVGGVTGKVNISMRDGADEVTITDVDFAGNLKIGLGKGADTLTLTDVTVGGNTTIKGQPGADEVTLDGFDGTGKLKVRLGGGDDLLTLIDVTVGGTADYNGGAGVDQIQMTPAVASWDLVSQKGFELFNFGPNIADQGFSIDENSADGTSVGTVAATDPDAGDTLTYAITAGNTDDAFAINAATGEITVNSTAALDFETNPTFALTVSVTDAGLLSDTATVTIDLNDLVD